MELRAIDAEHKDHGVDGAPPLSAQHSTAQTSRHDEEVAMVLIDLASWTCATTSSWNDLHGGRQTT